MQAHNPFIDLRPATPETFVGRESILELVFAQTFGSTRLHIAVDGPMGIGKTSLLTYIADPKVAMQRQLNPEEYILCMIDFRTLDNYTTTSFCKSVLREVSRVIRNELVTTLMEREEIDLIDLEGLLNELQEHNKTLILLLDEFDCAIQTETPSSERKTRRFLSRFLHLLKPHANIGVITASEQPLQELTNQLIRGTPFFTAFSPRRLRGFSEDEADEFIDRNLAYTDITFSPDERKRIYQYTKGHPARLKVAAAALFEAKCDGTANGNNIDQIIERALSQSPFRPSQKLELDERNKTAQVGNKHVDDLSVQEFDALKFLYDNAGKLCTYKSIWKAVWPDDEWIPKKYGPLYKTISRLRSKIGPQYIRTVRGRGYKLVLELE